MGFAAPAVVDLVLVANGMAMLVLGNMAFAPAMVPPGELVRVACSAPAAQRACCAARRRHPGAR